MNFFEVIILSIVEGVTEFLPVSSTGHLVLTTHFLNIGQTEFVKSFEILIQLGAILSVVVLYWKTLIQRKAVWYRIIAAFIPTGILGLTFYKFIKDILLGNELITLSALFLGGIVIIALEFVLKEKDHHVGDIEKLPIKLAVFIGLFQSLSMVPGMSRSASSIIGGLFMGLKRKTAVEFSFLLAIPTMIAASGLDLLESNLSFSQEEWLLLGIGFVTSFFVALLVIKYFTKFVEKHTFIPFGIYRILLAVFYWIIVIK